MLDRGSLVFAKIVPHPGNAFAPHDVIGVDEMRESGNRGHVPAHNDHRLRRDLAYALAHLTHLADVGDDRRNAADVILMLAEFVLKLLERGEVEYRAGRRDIALDHHDAPGAVEHAQRETALRARDLVVIELHGVDGARAE